MTSGSPEELRDLVLGEGGQRFAPAAAHQREALAALHDLADEVTVDALAREGIDCHFIGQRSEEHTSELQSQSNLVCRLLLEKKKTLSNTARIRSIRAIGFIAPHLYVSL